MTTFDRIRYAMAVLILVSGPGAVLFWFPIHPFVKHWRRVGARWAYVVGLSVYALSAIVLANFRRPLLSVDFGTNIVTISLGVACMIVHIVIRRAWRRHLKLSTLMGVPELARDQHARLLLTEGAYAWVRHPRYLEIIVGFVGYALFINYLAVYGVALFLVAGILVLIPIEERELVDQFGAAYEEYRRRVPALVPRLTR